jgi:hypothetical protein
VLASGCERRVAQISELLETEDLETTARIPNTKAKSIQHLYRTRVYSRAIDTISPALAYGSASVCRLCAAVYKHMDTSRRKLISGLASEDTALPLIMQRESSRPQLEHAQGTPVSVSALKAAVRRLHDVALSRPGDSGAAGPMRRAWRSGNVSSFRVKFEAARRRDHSLLHYEDGDATLGRDVRLEAPHHTTRLPPQLEASLATLHPLEPPPPPPTASFLLSLDSALRMQGSSSAAT